MLSIIPSILGATLAFAQTAYSVNEAETSVVLLVLLTGTIARDVMAR